MLTIEEYRVLNACADGPELFYFPFAELNYGRPILAVFNVAPDQRLGAGREPEVSGREVAGLISGLIRAGFLRCYQAPREPDGDLEASEPSEAEFAVYTGYDCMTWQDHVERFGYGPHEFETTESGIKEIWKPVYNRYDRTLGWISS